MFIEMHSNKHVKFKQKATDANIFIRNNNFNRPKKFRPKKSNESKSNSNFDSNVLNGIRMFNARMNDTINNQNQVKRVHFHIKPFSGYLIRCMNILSFQFHCEAQKKRKNTKKKALNKMNVWYKSFISDGQI